MEFHGLTLDKFQEQAIQSIEKNNSVVVSAPTGSGKTLIADYIISKYYGGKQRIIYTAPIKALSNQKYKEFSDEYGKDHIGLLTGDVVKNPTAKVLIMTTEVYRNMSLTQDAGLSDVSYVVFDEIHFINDRERGTVWEESIIFSETSTRFLCLSATIPNSSEFAEWIKTIKKHEVDVVKHEKRSVPLVRKFFDTELGVCTLKDIAEIADIPDHQYIRGRRVQRRPRTKPPSHLDLLQEVKSNTPLFFFCFSRQKCQTFAQELAKKQLFKVDKEVMAIVRKRLEGASPEILQLPTTKLLRYTLSCGVGFHHAGLLPLLKEIVEELFGKGLLFVLYTTETFAVGINMPAKTVCFESLRKFDGLGFRNLNSKEYFQIAGRAGRRGIDKKGYAIAMIARRDFDYRQLSEMTQKDSDPIKSQFQLSINTTLNLIKFHTQAEIDTIVKQSFFTFQQHKLRKKTIIKTVFERQKKKLEKLGYVKGDSLTPKGEFASHIYADELVTSEVFATELINELNEYQVLLVVAALAFESKEKTQFSKPVYAKSLTELKKTLKRNKVTWHEKRFLFLDEMTCVIQPLYEGGNLFSALDNTNMLEGDLIRFYRQILDRLGQIKAGCQEKRVKDLVSRCQSVLENVLKDIDTL